ncbi:MULTISPECIES: MarR family winged helix-turn-helix transcriptional regulator [Brevibacterium]|uniref:MarR family transcriptional regulator n=1 Tax=Brevibacterium salitolerans TaxID=1403566 RepID=A0ABN2WKU2_9MICO|nr:MarR family transcriptional regulator [Brevibacterium sp.]
MPSSHSSPETHPAAEDHVDRVQAEWRRERPEVDLGPQSVIARLHRVANTLTARLVEVYRQHGLSEGEFDVLCALRRAGEPYARQPAELARTTVVTTGGLTKRLDALERRGLVVREHSGGDGRTKIARLTPAGRQLIDTAFTAHMDNEAALVNALGEGERAEMERLLRTWQTALDAESAQH